VANNGPLSDIVFIVLPPAKILVDIATDVPPGQEEEYATLQEELEDERREHSDLIQRQGELTERIQLQEREVEQLKKHITTQEAKVCKNTVE